MVMNNAWERFLTHTILTYDQYWEVNRRYFKGYLDSTVQCFAIPHYSITLLDAQNRWIIHTIWLFAYKVRHFMRKVEWLLSFLLQFITADT